MKRPLLLSRLIHLLDKQSHLRDVWFKLDHDTIGKLADINRLRDDLVYGQLPP